MARRLTIELSDQVAARVEAEASRRGTPVDEVIEAAVVEHFGWRAVEGIRRRNADLDEQAALSLAYEELQAVRDRRRPA